MKQATVKVNMNGRLYVYCPYTDCDNIMEAVYVQTGDIIVECPDCGQNIELVEKDQ